MKQGLKKILIHGGIMTLVASVALYLLFGWYLPNYTRHGETITVPDLTDIHKDDLAEIIKKSALRYEIVDSLTYDRSSKPGVVISQMPKAGALVKENRRIYVNINAGEVPMVTLPKLKGQSEDNARFALQDLGFFLDSIQYKSGNQDGLVLGCLYEGDKISDGKELPQGSRLVLVVSRKHEGVKKKVPYIVGDPVSRATRVLRDSGFAVNVVARLPENGLVEGVDLGAVYMQRPDSGKMHMQGKYVDIFVNRIEVPKKEETEEGEEDGKPKED